MPKPKHNNAKPTVLQPPRSDRYIKTSLVPTSRMHIIDKIKKLLTM